MSFVSVVSGMGAVWPLLEALDPLLAELPPLDPLDLLSVAGRPLLAELPPVDPLDLDSVSLPVLELFELLVEPELELLSAGLSWVLPLLAESACTLRSPASVPPNSFTLTLRCDSIKLASAPTRSRYSAESFPMVFFAVLRLFDSVG